MKLLIVNLLFPGKHHAGGRFVCEILRVLSERHEISLVSRIDRREASSLDEIRPFCRKIYPYWYEMDPKRGIREIVRLAFNYLGFCLYAGRIAKAERFDVIQVEWVEAALLMRKKDALMILDAHDVMSKPAERVARGSRGFRRPFLFLRYLFIRKLEVWITRRFDVVFTRSEYDRGYLLSMTPGLKVKTVPHPAGLGFTDGKFERRSNTILFLASYKYRKVNVDAALYFYHSVFPRVRKTVPEAKFIIAGYGPPDALTELQEKDPGVTVTGFVEDIEQCYKQAAVFVAPILVGGGIIVKILDALAAGTPVVTTSYGNEGISAVAGRDLLVADDPEGFASAVIKLLRDTVFANQLAERGRIFVRKNYDLESVINAIELSYREVRNR